MGRRGNLAGTLNRSGAASLVPVLSFLFGLFLLATPAGASPGTASDADRGGAEETVWLRKPGIDDNPCLDGSFGGTRYLASGGDTPLDYSPAPKPRFDCFYIYPTQSEQAGANADLSRDQELKAVAVNQAAQFSRICDVYAPVYRQYTFNSPITDEVRDIAYEGVVNGWQEYLQRYNRVRGVILLGHSQGASHLSRLIDEEIDPSPALRRRMISAIVPGSNNVYVPRGGVVGGNLENIPACTRGDQLGCVMAWSLYLNKAESGLPEGANFGRLDTGYWVYPEDRPDPATYEVLCVNPAELSGAAGLITPLANLPAFLGQTNAPDPWTEAQGFYRAECLSGEDSSWLDLSAVPGVPASILDGVIPLINSNLGGLHTGDVNLVLGDLITIASRQGARYLSWRKAVERSMAADKALERARTALVKASAQARKATAACKSSGSRALCRKARSAEAREGKARERVKKLETAARKAAAAAEQAYGSA